MDTGAHHEVPTKEKKRSTRKSSASIWTIKITVISFLITIFFSFLSEITANNSSLLVAIFVIIILITVNILFDGIAVAVTSCELAPFLSMASKKVPGSRTAIFLVNNAEKVSNICADVIGDVCGIISGACSAAITVKMMLDPSFDFWVSILINAIIAAITIGGKAFGKFIAVKYNKEYIMFTAKIVSIFRKEK
ncbi:MAG: hypothetical protein IKD20_03340 [Clostridia bacterium]|nr:hypothetical protein [Clostridia bacterium]